MTSYYLEKEELTDDETDWSHEDDYDRETYPCDNYEETWHEEYSESEFGEKPVRDTPEPEPPDSYQPTSGYPKPWIKFNDRFYVHESNPPLTQAITFSGTNNYHDWIDDMEDYYWDYNIPDENKVTHAEATLTGEAYQWWLQRERYRISYRGGFHRPPAPTWENMKWHLYEQFVRGKIPTSPFHKPATTPMRKPSTKLAPTPKKVLTTPKTQATTPGKCTVQETHIEITCYRCKGLGHVAKFCPTRKVTTKLEPVQQNQNREPQVIQGQPMDQPKVSILDSFTEVQQSHDKMMHILNPMTEQESLKAKEKQEIVSNPEIKEVKTETCEIILNDSMTILTHLSSVKGVEKVSGTTEDITDKEEASSTMVFSDQMLSHEETPPMLNEAVAEDDDCVLATIQIKEEPPDAPPIEKTHCKLLNPYTLQWNNLKYFCAEVEVSRTKLLEEGGYDEVLESLPCIALDRKIHHYRVGLRVSPLPPTLDVSLYGSMENHVWRPGLHHHVRLKTIKTLRGTVLFFPSPSFIPLGFPGGVLTRQQPLSAPCRGLDRFYIFILWAKVPAHQAFRPALQQEKLGRQAQLGRQALM